MKHSVKIFTLLTFVVFIQCSGKARPNSSDENIPSESNIPSNGGLIYYVDSENGNDKNNGNTPEMAWRTLNKVNLTTFRPGSKILFKAGNIWIGQLRPGGSGAKNNPIIIDKYGDGPKPLIDANGKTGAVLSLHNQSYWEINNLELTNDAPEKGMRNGVDITAENAGIIEHIYLKNLYIHNIKGIPGDNNRTSGIFIQVLSDDLKPTRFNDVLIEGCEIAYVENQGICTRTPGKWKDVGFNLPGTASWTKRRFTNLAIRNNVIHHISKNAMIIRMADKGVVEHNVCYETALKVTGNTIFSYGCRGTVFQYNEGYLNRSPSYDGSMYDADRGSPKTVWQYSYSHDNTHGLIWLIPYDGSDSIIVRYNISQNDRGNLVTVTGGSGWSAFIYNNVFYIDSSLSPAIIHEYYEGNRTYHFYNNIVYNSSRTSKYIFVPDPGTVGHFSHNLFYGYHPNNEPADPFKITSEPLFVNPGKGRVGLNTVGGYKLQPGSPAIDKGKLIPNNGGWDYFDLPVSDTDPPNIGAYNGKGTNAASHLNIPGLIEQPDKRIDGAKLDDRENNEMVLFTVNGLDVTVQEFTRVLQECKANVFSEIISKNDFADIKTFRERINSKKTNPFDKLEETILNRVVHYKVQEGLLRKHGLWPYTSYADFLIGLKKRNAAREKSKKLGRVVFGPVVYTERAFWGYVFSNALIELKEKLKREKLLNTSNDIDKAFNTYVGNLTKDAIVSFDRKRIIEEKCRDAFIGI